MTIPLRDRLRTALPTAMKARDAATVSALRSALAAIENAAAVAAPPPVDGPSALGLPAVGLGVTEVARRDVDDAEVERIVRAEVSERLDAADGYDKLGRAEQAARLRAEARALTVQLGLT
jgi:hypothetical protein